MFLRSSRFIALLGGLAGAILFAYAIRRAGISDILYGIARVGWGLLLVLALGGLRFLLRAECWRLCMPHARTGSSTPPLGLGHALSAFLAGDAIGSVTPLGLLASEPTKVFLTRHHLATGESVASLAIENLVYAASVIAMIGVGVAVLLGEIALPPWWWWAAIALLATLLIVAAVGARMLRGTGDEARGTRPRWRERLASIRMSVVGFSGDYRTRLWRVFALDLLFHGLAVIEIYVTLRWLTGAGVTWTQAIVFEALNRVVTVVFKFVPFRIGVDEALTGALAPVLALDPAAGVALAVVRKIRNLFWTGVGLGIVAAHPARVSAARAERATDRRESATAQRP
jgi:hypothetical protein